MTCIQIILLIIAVFLIFIIFESKRELGKVRLTEYVMRSSRVPQALKGKIVVFLSDYHEAEHGKINSRIIELIKGASPECILIGGDMINGGKENEDISPAAELIEALSNDYPIYFASGNHEMKIREGIYPPETIWENFYERIRDRVTITDNMSVDISHCFGADENTVRVYGLDLSMRYFLRRHFTMLKCEDIEKLIGKVDKESFNILLAHNPEYYEAYKKWDADLTLSGHFHGGMVRLPILGGVISPRLKFFPKYDYGMFDNRFIVTNGLGQHSVKLRFYNIPEVVVIRFEGA